jgi:hypothetical protein
MPRPRVTILKPLNFVAIASSIRFSKNLIAAMQVMDAK